MPPKRIPRIVTPTQASTIHDSGRIQRTVSVLTAKPTAAMPRSASGRIGGP
jgi:hypothetical protein